ncbi:hypothetical protein [Metabacillus bambusae]|uniref:DUF4025 domain-containing protein n=1 Tax=Metabacillus bambusae TaxID=2795218 RepID=A0ABS3N221_9BACI|nr:hypothetical protein [Metabacillus bambusae]MBO1512298.1 hypothetical protein [Metabacillus bambusae]
MNRYEANEKIQKSLGKHGPDPKQQENETYTANYAIQNRFYEENEVEDNIDTTLSTSSNIGAVLLPVEDEEKDKKKNFK